MGHPGCRLPTSARRRVTEAPLEDRWSSWGLLVMPDPEVEKRACGLTVLLGPCMGTAQDPRPEPEGRGGFAGGFFIAEAVSGCLGLGL